MTFSSQRLTLSEFELTDAGFILELINDPDFIRFIGDKKVRNIPDAEGYITSGPMKSYTENGFGLWKVSLTETGVPIGMCGLIRRETLPTIDIGYAFLPAFRAQGYAF
jgi:RimJ/RimL family protein N-acetyltransferase